MTIVPFSEWTPDRAAFNGASTGDILNVLPAGGSYLPFPDFAALSAALPAKPIGHFQARDLSGQITVFAGTATKLYKLDLTDYTWSDVSQTAVTYSANDTAQWDFEQFGDYVVAVNINDDPQVFQLGTSTEFSDLGGSPPRAAFVTAWGDFLVLQQLANNANRSHWSALNDITGWTPGTDNSDYQDFAEGGVVQGSTRATNPVVILERAIFKGTFVPGSIEIFTFKKIHDARGAKSPYSIASRGENTFFADEGGFYQMAGDGSIAPIGFEKVDRTIFGQMQASDIAGIVGAIDPFYSRVYWALDLTGTGSFSAILVYDWLLQKWTIADQDNYGVFPAATAGYTLEGLDDVSTSIDDLPFSLDAKAWQGGAPVLAAFDTSYQLGFFNALPKQATITTQEQGDTGGRVTLISSVYPVVDNDNCTIAVGSRDKRGEVVTWTPEISASAATGRFDLLSAARFQRVRITIPAGEAWDHAQGVDIAAQAAGMR